jgi:hypothetical protein
MKKIFNNSMKETYISKLSEVSDSILQFITRRRKKTTINIIRAKEVKKNSNATIFVFLMVMLSIVKFII